HYEIWLIFFLKYFIYFFFSSRRRHTISKRDWSSDVCSSDLTHRYSAGWAYPTAAAGGVLGIAVLSMFFARWFRQRVRLRGRLARSEERRVGKESGCWRRARNGKRRNKTGRRADRVHNST